MDERFRRVRQGEERIQMLLGIIAAQGVLPLELRPARNVIDLLVRHIDQLEREAQATVGIQQLLSNHFAKVYKVSLSAVAA